jgi:hypothetical protein
MSEQTTADTSVWDTLDHTPSPRQRGFIRYSLATLVDLVVLNLFIEYCPQWVTTNAFTTTLLAAVLIQILLKLTIALEHRLAAYYNAKPGKYAKFMRYFTAWLVLFGSKFVILEVLALAFDKDLHFGGPLHGVVALIAVVVAMLVAEVVLVKLYRRLG